MIEKVVAKRLTEYCLNKNRLDPFQSAYREQHSTETALVCVVNYIRTAMDKKQDTISVQIDLSSAFDTTDHGILLKRLE